jgi:hypothetical protein
LNIAEALPATDVRFGSLSAGHGRQKPTDSVEKVGLPKLPDHLLVKTPFSHTAA